MKKSKKNILIIGGTGFIGFHLLKKTTKLGWNSFSISKNRPKKNRKVNKVKYIFLNISNLNKLKKNFLNNYDYIVNLTDITTSTLFFLKKKNFKKLLHVGSSAEYGNLRRLPHKENFVCKPISAYGRKKLSITKNLLKSFKKKFFPLIIVRMFQVYGPFDNSNKIIPQVLQNCLKNRTLKLTAGYQTRDFCHIDDVVRAIILLLKNENNKIYGNIFNIGSGKAVTIKYLANKIKNKINKGKLKFNTKKLKKNEIIYSKASIKKIKRFVNWVPRISLENGLKRLIIHER